MSTARKNLKQLISGNILGVRDRIKQERKSGRTFRGRRRRRK